MMGLDIGIDLGTTYSCLAYVDRSGEIRIATDEDGEPTLPSVVLFSREGYSSIGYEAKRSMDPLGTTIESIKRRMGEPDSYCVFNGQRYEPPTISAMFLKTLLGRVKDLIDREGFGNVVIAHPAYFGASHIQATREAGIIAGIPEDRLILMDEPTAVAIGETHDRNGSRTVLIYDLGGGTFDVSILRIDGNDVTCVAIGGDKNLGGKEWDYQLIDLCLLEIEDSTFGDLSREDIEDDPESILQIRKSVEDIKIELSSKPQAYHTFRFGTRDVNVRITRELFEETTMGFVQTTIETVERCIRESGVETIDEIVLAGGSSNMPMIQRAMQDRYGERVRCCTNPEESVAIGAAIYSNSLRNDEDDRGDGGTSIRCVLSKTYGIKTLGRDGNVVISNILYRNRELPILDAERSFGIPDVGLSLLAIELYENDGLPPNDDTMPLDDRQSPVGSFYIDVPRGMAKGDRIGINFEVDEQKSISCRVKWEDYEMKYPFVPDTALKTEQIDVAMQLLLVLDD